jgi:Lrp/AsnC family transcriptional regulator, leucine-responsive regulatory protein
MDAIDLRVLDLVQRDATLTNEKLGELVGASASAVHRRLGRLRRTGVIRAVVTIVDQAAVGSPLSFVVGLEIERKQVDLYDRLQRWLLSEDAVQQAYNVTGSSDFVIVVTAATVEGYDELMDRLLAANPNVRKYSTNVVLRSFKKCLFVPVLP